MSDSKVGLPSREEIKEALKWLDENDIFPHTNADYGLKINEYNRVARNIVRAYLSGQLCEPMSYDEVKLVIKKSICGKEKCSDCDDGDDCEPDQIAESLAGKVPKQFVPMSEQYIEDKLKIRICNYVNPAIKKCDGCIDTGCDMQKIKKALVGHIKREEGKR